MPIRRIAAAAIIIVLASPVVRADSPLTSTDFASVYLDVPAVKEARSTRRVAGDVLRFLLSTEPNDRKAAVVNALGWKTTGNAAAFLDGVAAARGVASADVKLTQLTASDRFVLGYLRAMETYADPIALRPGALDVWGMSPKALLDQASQALPADFTVQYTRALIEAQHAMGDSFCSAYLATRRVIDQFPSGKRNMRPAAVAAAQSYMDAYKDDCPTVPKKPESAARPAALTPEHNQIYSIGALGSAIVAGTQAGVVVWSPDRKEPVASRSEKLCSHVFVWRDAAWSGCLGALVRWNGTAWKAYLQDPSRADSPFVPFAGPAGELLARNGADVWRYDAARDAFSQIRLNLPGEPYDVLYRRNGELWRIDFLKAVVGPNGPFPVKSASYPGGDPRRLVEDSMGRLWVLDFKAGAFRLSESGDRFERDPALDDKASTVAVDGPRGRTWLLHYTRGPMLREGDAAAQPVADLGGLQMMRDLLVDEKSGDVWVAAWNGLARLHEDRGRWKIDTWRAGGR